MKLDELFYTLQDDQYIIVNSKTNDNTYSGIKNKMENYHFDLLEDKEVEYIGTNGEAILYIELE